MADAPLPGGKGTVKRLLERAVAVARQDRHAVRALVDDGHAEVAVAGEIAGRDGNRHISGRAAGRLLERAVARAQKHRDVVRPDVSGREIQAAVAGEITRNDIQPGRSPLPRSLGLTGPVVGLLIAAWKVPLPLPMSTETALALRSATARSRWPLPKSPATIE